VAGMMFMVVAALNFFLMHIYKENKMRLGPRMAFLQKYRLPFFLLPILVFMTGSRMPLACTALVFLIALIPRFKNTRTGVIVVLLVAAVFSVVLPAVVLMEIAGPILTQFALKRAGEARPAPAARH